MKRYVEATLLLLMLALFASSPASAQTTEGPLVPVPGTPVQQAPPQTKLQIRVSLVNTPVTVRDSKGQMVHDLDESSFRITDNGVPQKIVHFDLGGDPISLVVLVETSSRVAPFMPQLRKTGILLTQTVMGPTGEGAIITFNDDVDKLQDFTTNADAIERKMEHLQSGSAGSKLYDAMAAGIEMLTSRQQPTAENSGRRRVMLIISEAADRGSQARFGEVLRQAQLANVTIYSVGLSTTRAEMEATPPPTDQPQITPPGTISGVPFPGSVPTPDNMAARYGYGNVMNAVVWAVTHVNDQLRATPLQIATAGTGGADLPTFKDRSIEKAIDEIGGELHSQYTLSYAPTDTNATGFHEIKVTVDKKNLKVRSRPGYYLGQ